MLVFQSRRTAQSAYASTHSDSTQRYAYFLTTYPHWRNSLKRNCLASWMRKLDILVVHLNEDSHLVTTFRTPFGRYFWRRPSFELNVSQDIFQSRMHQTLEGLKGVTGIGDDACVYAENSEDHDRNLTNLLDRAHEDGLVFNSAKVPHQANKYHILWKHLHLPWDHT